MIKHNRLTSGELLSNDRRAVGLSVASHGGGAPGADGGNTGLGGNSAVGGGGNSGGGGSTGGVSQPLRTALHTISISTPKSLS